MQDGFRFVSKPNKCDGCPLDHIAPRWAKVTNLCEKMARGWEVKYLLDDFGHTICEVRENRNRGFYGPEESREKP